MSKARDVRSIKYHLFKQDKLKYICMFVSLDLETGGELLKLPRPLHRLYGLT